MLWIFSSNMFFEVMAYFGIAIGIILFIGMIVMIADSAKKKKKLKAEQQQVEAKHLTNLDFLSQWGFRIEDSTRYNHTGTNLYFDYTNRKAAYEIYRPLQLCTNITIFPLNKIVECDLIENGSVVSSETGGLGGAVIMGYGVMGGSKGAYSAEMGGVLAVRLTIDDLRIPSVTINVLTSAMDKSSNDYQAYYAIAQAIYGRFQGIVRYNKNHPEG